MKVEDLLEEALTLNPDDRRAIVDGILRSIDQPNTSIDAIWASEAQRRPVSYRAGKLGGVPMEELFRR